MTVIEEALGTLTEILVNKRRDYASDLNPFSNFWAAADTAQITVEQSLLSQIGIKIARINNLMGKEGTPNNESLLDSFQDLAGYAVILYAFALEQQVQDERLAALIPKGSTAYDN